MPNGETRDGFFYPTLTLMIDSYNLLDNEKQRFDSKLYRQVVGIPAVTISCASLVAYI